MELTNNVMSNQAQRSEVCTYPSNKCHEAESDGSVYEWGNVLLQSSQVPAITDVVVGISALQQMPTTVYNLNLKNVPV